MHLVASGVAKVLTEVPVTVFYWHGSKHAAANLIDAVVAYVPRRAIHQRKAEARWVKVFR